MSFLTSTFASKRRLNQPILPYNSIQIKKTHFKKLLTTTSYKNGGEKIELFQYLWTFYSTLFSSRILKLKETAIAEALKQLSFH